MEGEGKSGPPVSAYTNKRVDFQFRGMSLRFDLSQELFSSGDIDRGTRLLLRLFSTTLDTYIAEGRPLPASLLDAGSGTGVIGVAAARALMETPARNSLEVRAQDRDELARVFTEANARLNGVPPEILRAHTEPLLAGGAARRWDFILSNLPAKTGEPVLADFILRSGSCLNPGGRVLLVIVTPLADRLRERVAEAGYLLLYDKEEKDHTLFMYEAGETRPPVVSSPDDPFPGWPAYARRSGDYVTEGISYRIDSFHGAADFDRVNGAAEAAAALWKKLWPGRLDWHGQLDRPRKEGRETILIHEPGQGHFPVWLSLFLARESEGPREAHGRFRWVLSGRNIISLSACRHNLGRHEEKADIVLAPSVELTGLPAEKGAQSSMIVFPEAAARRVKAYWEAFMPLLERGGALIIAASSSEAEKFDREKPKAFTRLGSLKRGGFRALAYRKD